MASVFRIINRQQTKDSIVKVHCCYEFYLAVLTVKFELFVETVALLSKLSETKHHIEVKVDMDEQDLTSAKAKATYKVSAAVVT